MPNNYSINAEPGSYEWKGFAPTIIIHGRDIASGDTVTRVNAPGSESVARLSLSGRISLTVTGTEGVGRPGEIRVSQVLCERLLQEGRCVELLPGRDARGEDGTLRMAERNLSLQIVTVPSTPEFGRTARHSSASTAAPLDGAIDWINATIQKKVQKTVPMDRRTMVLALDAQHASSLAEPAVIEAYLKEYGDPSSNYGFAGVWIVGSASAQCTRIGKGVI
jgi:hypothetical protein